MQVFIVGSFVVACSVIVARLPRAGESLDATAFLTEPGGKGFNLALATRRLGARVDGAFAIGDDLFATIADQAFRRAGLDTGMLLQREGSTGAGVGFVDRDGDNCLAVSLGANRLLAAEDIERVGGAIDGADMVMATFESPDAPIRAAFARARARGAATLLNPSPSRPIDPEILADTTILVANEVEADDLALDGAMIAATARCNPPAVEALIRAGPRTVVVTLGDRGAVAFQRGRAPIRQPAFRVPVLDTIGAGDAFSAGLAVALMEHRPIEEALRRAAACGALTARQIGAFDAFPRAGELACFLDAGRDGPGSGGPGSRIVPI